MAVALSSLLLIVCDTHLTHENTNICLFYTHTHGKWRKSSQLGLHPNSKHKLDWLCLSVAKWCCLQVHGMKIINSMNWFLHIIMCMFCHSFGGTCHIHPFVIFKDVAIYRRLLVMVDCCFLVMWQTFVMEKSSIFSNLKYMPSLIFYSQ